MQTCACIVCIYVCMYVRMYVCVYACTQAGTYACTYVCMYVCVCVCVLTCTSLYIHFITIYVTAHACARQSVHLLMSHDMHHQLSFLSQHHQHQSPSRVTTILFIYPLILHRAPRAQKHRETGIRSTHLYMYIRDYSDYSAYVQYVPVCVRICINYFYGKH